MQKYQSFVATVCGIKQAATFSTRERISQSFYTIHAFPVQNPWPKIKAKLGEKSLFLFEHLTPPHLCQPSVSEPILHTVKMSPCIAIELFRKRREVNRGTDARSDARSDAKQNVKAHNDTRME